MKKLIFIVLLICAQMTWAKGEKPVDAIKVNPYGKYFEAKSEVTVELALIEGKNADDLQDVLLKINGAPAHEEGIDGKVMYYKAEPAGTGYNLVYQKEGQDRVRMISRDSWGMWKNFEIYVNGQKYNIYANADKAKDVKTAHLLTEYKQTQKK